MTITTSAPKNSLLYASFLAMCVNNLPKVATQWNSGATPGIRTRDTELEFQVC